MVAAFDYCLHGKGGAAPSIDTAMHGLVDAAHVDHLHPDSGIAIATAADGEAADHGDLRRPGRLGARGAVPASSSASTSPRSRRRTRRRSACILGGHGITAWGDTSAGVRGAARCGSSTPPRRTSPSTARPSRSARPLDGYGALPEARAPRQGRRARADASAASPRPTGRWSATSPTPTWCSTSSPPTEHPRLAELGHVVPGPLPAHQGQAAGPRPAGRRAPSRTRWRGCKELHAALPRGLPGLLRPQRDARTQPAIRGADPADRAGARASGCSSYGKDKQTARVRRRVLPQRDQRDARRRGALDVRPDRRGREVPHRVLGAGGGQARSGCRSRSRSPPGSRWSPAPPPASARPSPTRLAAEGACVVIADLDAGEGAGRRRRDRRRPTSRSASRPTSPTRPPCRRRSTPPCSPSAASTSWSTTPACRCRSRCWRPPWRTGTCSTT